MDPNQTWSDIAVAVEKGNWERAAELAGELVRWIDKGGFVPSVTWKPVFDKILVYQTCTALQAWDVVP